jgi:Co/Zn/Cd efflux system component
MGSAHLSWLGHGHHSHDHAHSADDALRDSAAGIQAVKISLVVLGLTAVAQLAIVAASGSVGLFADTVHNFSDALTGGASMDRFLDEPAGGHPSVHVRLWAS